MPLQELDQQTQRRQQQQHTGQVPQVRPQPADPTAAGGAAAPLAASAAAVQLASRMAAASLRPPRTGHDFEATWRGLKGDQALQVGLHCTTLHHTAPHWTM